VSNQTVACSRPNCSKLNKDEFFVEKLVGRRMKENGSEYEWLVKYDGCVLSPSFALDRTYIDLLFVFSDQVPYKSIYVGGQSKYRSLYKTRRRIPRGCPRRRTSCRRAVGGCDLVDQGGELRIFMEVRGLETS
jgi:hypothetical protein